MRSDPATDMYSDRADLCAINPNAFVTGLRNASRRDSKTCERVDQRLLNAPKIGAYIAPPFSQIQYGIAHDLTGTMICHIAAPVGLEQVNSGSQENFLASEHMVSLCIAANRYDMRVLHKQKRVDPLAVLALFDELLLYRERLRIAHASQIHQFKRSHAVLLHNWSLRFQRSVTY